MDREAQRWAQEANAAEQQRRLQEQMYGTSAMQSAMYGGGAQYTPVQMNLGYGGGMGFGGGGMYGNSMYNSGAYNSPYGGGGMGGYGAGSMYGGANRFGAGTYPQPGYGGGPRTNLDDLWQG